jgi:hypothetical protein
VIFFIFVFCFLFLFLIQMAIWFLFYPKLLLLFAVKGKSLYLSSNFAIFIVLFPLVLPGFVYLRLYPFQHWSGS